MDLFRFARFPLGHFPTPLEPLKRLSGILGGPTLYMKRDDATGLAFGGNKTRKLEYLLADALAEGADTLVTAGGIQSNHVRQTAAAARKAGLACHAVLDEPEGNMASVFSETGNILLDNLFNCVCEIVPAGTDLNAEAHLLCERLREQGKIPYFIPVGGSNAIGALGYVQAIAELLQQTDEAGITIDRIIVGTGSAGTHAGLLAGLSALERSIKVTGIAVSATAPIKTEMVHRLAAETCNLIGNAQTPDLDQVDVRDAYVGTGYGQPTEGMVEAVRLLASEEAILLDPVYSGKAMAGMIDLIRQGEFEETETIVFLHTGGSPALFAYPQVFLGMA